jgi:hypothetical protein
MTKDRAGHRQLVHDSINDNTRGISTIEATTGWCTTSPVTLLLRVVSLLSKAQYGTAWAHFKAIFVLYTFVI